MLVLVTQVFWAIDSYLNNKKEIKTKVNSAMTIAAKKGIDHSSCFEIFSKAYLTQGEGFYLTKYRADKTIDTIPMLYTGRGLFYNESKQFLDKYNRIDFGSDVTAEIVVNFRYQFSDSNFRKISQDSVFKKLNKYNYREILSENLRIDKLYDMQYIDSTLRSELLKVSIDKPYSMGIIRAADSVVVYKNSAVADSLFRESEYKSNLNDERYFNKQYNLSLVFDNNFIIGKTLWLMLLTSAFVVMLLIALMWRFIRVITRQRKINEMKNDFINNMTHEFNTPIANISLASETLSKNKNLLKDEKISKLVNIITEQNEHIRENVEYIRN
jgi:hypothetical protein